MEKKIKRNCPNCGVELFINEAFLGKKIKCPKCNEVFLIQKEEEKRKEVKTIKRKRQHRKQQPKKKKNNTFVVLGGLLGVLVLVIVFVFVFKGGPPSYYVDAKEKALSLKDPGKKIVALVELALNVKKDEWKGADEEVNKILEKAYTIADSSEPTLAVIDKLIEVWEKLKGSRFSNVSKKWLDKAISKLDLLPDSYEKFIKIMNLIDKIKELKINNWEDIIGELGNKAYSTCIKLGSEGKDPLFRLAETIQSINKDLSQTCYKRIIEIDPKNEKAHIALGHERVPNDSPVKDMRGMWLDTITKKRLYRTKLREIKKREEKRKAEEYRWKKDTFARLCRMLKREMENEIPGKKWHFFFDDEYIKRPYLLAVEESINPTTEGIANEMGQVLNGLVTNFYKKYQKLLSLSKPRRPVGVFIFKTKSSYAQFQKNHKNEYPNPIGIGGFFKGDTGRLYLWAKDDMQMGGDKMDLTAIMFHEGTHQLMHYNKETPGPMIGNSPWLQEGIAEFFAGYYTRINPKTGKHEYKNGKFLEYRYKTIARAAYQYRETGKAGPGLMPLKKLIYLDYPQFWNAKRRNPFILSIVYAEGWAFIHFLNHYEKNGIKGYYRKKFEEFLKAEIQGISSPEKFEKIFGIKSDRDWKNLEREFFLYLTDSDKGMRKYMYEAENRKPGYWPEDDED